MSLLPRSRLGDGCLVHTALIAVFLGGFACWSAGRRARRLLFDACLGCLAADDLESHIGSDLGTTRTTDRGIAETTQTSWEPDFGRAGGAGGAAAAFDGVGPDT